MYLKEHRKSGFWISVFGYRAIVQYKENIVHWTIEGIHIITMGGNFSDGFEILV